MQENPWGIKNFQPARMDGDNDEAINGHQRFLLTCSVLADDTRDRHSMDLAMNHTFADRRAMVLDGVSRVGDVSEVGDEDAEDKDDI